MAKYRQGGGAQDETGSSRYGSDFVQQVIRPLVQRGYLPGYYAQDVYGKWASRWAYDDTVKAAVKRFQRDQDINDGTQRVPAGYQGGSTVWKNQKIYSGVVGNRTLAALSKPLPDPENVQAYERWTNTLQTRQQRTVNADPNLAQNLAAVRKWYPWIPAKAAAAFVFGGIKADDPAWWNIQMGALRDKQNPFWSKKAKQVQAFQAGDQNALQPKDFSPLYDTRHPTAAIVADTGSGDLWDHVWGGLKAVVRTGLVAAETPYQGVQATFRNSVSGLMNLPGVVENPTGAGQGVATQQGPQNSMFTGSPQDIGSQTSGGLALNALLHGQNVDLGSGFLPGGKIEHEQAANARAALAVDGHAGTIGRVFASLVTEPGTAGYNVLSGLTDVASILALDPANIALKGLGEAHQASKVISGSEAAANLERSGLINAVRRSFVPMTAEQFLESPGGRRAVDWLSQADDYNQIRKVVGGNASLALDLKDAATPEAVKDALTPVLGTTLRTKFSTPGDVFHPLQTLGYEVQTYTDRARWAGVVPGRFIDPRNVDQGVSELDAVQLNAKLPYAQRVANNEKLARAYADGEPAVLQATKDIMGDINAKLLANHVPEDEARKLTRLFVDDYTKTRGYMVDELGNHVVPPDSPSLQVDGAGLPLPMPVREIDLLHNRIPLPDIESSREIKRLTGALGPVYRNKLLGGTIKGSAYAADQFYGKLFKPFILIRGAWPVRVIGEEQVRMAASGLDSMFKHPASYIAWRVARKAGLTEDDFLQAARAAALGGGQSEYGQALSGGLRALFDNTRDLRMFAEKTVFDRTLDPAGHVNAWLDELARNHDSPSWRYFAGHDSTDAKQWFFEGEGKQYRDRLIAGKIIDDSRAAADNYVDFAYQQLQQITGNDGDLLNAVATGKIGDTPLYVSSKGGGLTRNKAAAEHLSGLQAEGLGPIKVLGDKPVTDASRVSRWNEFTDKMFGALMGARTNNLSRSPTFRQYYWQRVEELLPYMDDGARTKALAQAEKTFGKILPGDRSTGILDRLRTAAMKPSAADPINLDTADTLAKGFALESTRDLLYDLSKRSQFFDATRLVFPFGEAWQEVLTRWAKIAAHNPAVFRRGQTIVDGARGAGFFYKDPVTGDEVFNYPLTGEFTGMALGTPIPLAGRVQGLNMIGNGLPGVGPVLQIPAAYLLPDTPEWNTVRQFIFPYGDQGTATDPVSKIEQQISPPYLDKLRIALGNSDPDAQRQYANTVMQIARYKMSSGQYGTDQDSVQRLMADAKEEARWFFVIRAFGSYVSPSAPIAQYQTKDLDGHLVLTAKLADELRKLETEDYDSAAGKFIAKYGKGVYAGMESLSKSIRLALPVTKRGEDWAVAHPDVTSKYPNVYGFFAPSKPNDKFDIEVYNRQLRNGERVSVPPDVWSRLANDRIGSYLYYKAKDKVKARGLENDPAGQKYLRDYRDWLKQAYYGFDRKEGFVGRVTTVDAQDELRRAISDPALKSTPAARALSKYFTARDRVAKDYGNATGWQTSDRGAAYRSYLHEMQVYLAGKYSQAGPIFDLVFRNDVRDLPNA